MEPTNAEEPWRSALVLLHTETETPGERREGLVGFVAASGRTLRLPENENGSANMLGSGDLLGYSGNRGGGESAGVDGSTSRYVEDLMQGVAEL